MFATAQKVALESLHVWLVKLFSIELPFLYKICAIFINLIITKDVESKGRFF